MGSIPSLGQWVEGTGVSKTMDQIQPLVREVPYATDGAIKKKKRIQHCHCCGLGYCCGAGSFLAWELEHVMGTGKKKKVKYYK